jgi:hypothetical protein
MAHRRSPQYDWTAIVARTAPDFGLLTRYQQVGEPDSD